MTDNIKIFVISLKNSLDKRNNITSELTQLGLNYEIFDAIDGKLLSKNDLKKILHTIETPYLTRGEIGCALSHLEIYKIIVDNNISHALILEDDSSISPYLKDFLTDFNKVKNGSCLRNEVFLLQKSRSFFKNKKITINEQFIFHEAYNPKGTYGYIISKTAAKNLLKINSPLILEADHWLGFYELSLMKVYSLNTGLVFISKKFENKSSISPERNPEKSKQLNLTKKKLLKKNLNYRIYRLYHKFFRRILLKKFTEKNFSVEYHP